MKRPLAIALTIAIFAAIAVCFLRPAPPYYVRGNTLVIAGQRVDREIRAVDLANEGYLPICENDLVKLEVHPTLGNRGVMLTFRAQSLDESLGFLFGARIVEDGEAHYLSEGRVLDRSTGEDVGFVSPMIGWLTQEDGVYPDGAATPNEPSFFRKHIAADHPGEYTVELYLYEYDPETGTLPSEQPHTISFDVEIKDMPDGMYTCGAYWEQPAGERSMIRVHLPIYRADGSYLSVDRDEAVKLERRTLFGWQKVEDRVADVGGGDPYTTYYIHVLPQIGRGDYRLTFELLDVYGKSGETRTVKLRFSFGS